MSEDQHSMRFNGIIRSLDMTSKRATQARLVDHIGRSQYMIVKEKLTGLWLLDSNPIT